MLKANDGNAVQKNVEKRKLSQWMLRAAELRQIKVDGNQVSQLEGLIAIGQHFK